MPKIDVENQNAFIEAAKWERLLGVQSSNSKAVCSTSRRSWSTARNPDSSSLRIDCEQAFLVKQRMCLPDLLAGVEPDPLRALNDKYDLKEFYQIIGVLVDG